MILAVNKLNGRDLSNTTRCERLPKKTKVMHHLLQKDYQTVTTSWSFSVIKVNGQMHTDAFKRKLGFSFTVII